jgi:hypothetical protein
LFPPQRHPWWVGMPEVIQSVHMTYVDDQKYERRRERYK